MAASLEHEACWLPARAELPQRVVARLQDGGWRDADVLLVEGPTGPLVVKDFGPRWAWVRQTLGRVMVWRELRAYRALRGHPAVPRLLGRLDAFAFAVEYRPGQRMTRAISGQVSADFPEELEKAILAMHDLGVAHLDLRHRSNVLVGEDGAPILIDFASAVCFRPGSAAARLLLPLFAHYDMKALREVARAAARLLAAPARGRGHHSSGRGASFPT